MNRGKKGIHTCYCYVTKRWRNVGIRHEWSFEEQPKVETDGLFSVTGNGVDVVAVGPQS